MSHYQSEMDFASGNSSKAVRPFLRDRAHRKPLSQSEKILAFLETGAELSSMEAIQRWSCTRLAARIGDLRGRGHQIESRLEHRNGKKFAVYWMP